MCKKSPRHQKRVKLTTNDNDGFKVITLHQHEKQFFSINWNVRCERRALVFIVNLTGGTAYKIPFGHTSLEPTIRANIPITEIIAKFELSQTSKPKTRALAKVTDYFIKQTSKTTLLNNLISR